MAGGTPDVRGPKDSGEHERATSKASRDGRNAGPEAGKGVAADAAYHTFNSESAASYYSEQVLRNLS